MWLAKGKNIRYETRTNRQGYKAGALKEDMKHACVAACEFIAMFDADFQPKSNFLLRTVPFLVHNHDVALVQARWKFVNANECLMTRMQEMSMDYHFKVEQESGSTSCAFFGYNGTAGVWRIRAISEAGGWKDRKTVEDMDLAVRADLAGWKFVYIGNIKRIIEHLRSVSLSAASLVLPPCKFVSKDGARYYRGKEGIHLEEVICDIPFLLRTEDRLAHRHLLLLMRGDPDIGLLSRS